MRLIDIPQKLVFGVENLDSKNDRVEKFVAGLRSLASTFKGRIMKLDVREKTIRVSVASDEVFVGIVEYLKGHGIEAREVKLLDEFFSENQTAETVNN